MSELKETILVVDDQPELLENIALTLEAAGYAVATAQDGAQALELLSNTPPDLILADIAMPQLNGYQLFERVRENPDWVAIPFLFLTARALDSDIRYGKELGADDYLTKPIQPEDLLAVVRGKLRRAEQIANNVAGDPTMLRTRPRIIRIGRLEIDPGRHDVVMNGRVVRLSAREFKLLLALAIQAGNVASAQNLVKATHGYETDPIEAGNLLRPLIRSVRRKMGYPVGEMGCIENVRGVGYRLVVADQ